MSQNIITTQSQNASVGKRQHVIARGTVFLLLGQISTIVGGMIVHVIGGRTLSPKHYSQFVLAFSIIVVLQLLLTAGFPKTFSFLASRFPQSAWYLTKRGCLVVFGVSVVVWSIYAVVCLWLGDFTMDDNRQVLILAALVLPPISLFFSGLGIINGLQLFALESFLTSFYYLFRTIVISLMFIITTSVMWGLIGNIFAAIISCILLILLIYPRLRHHNAKPIFHLHDSIKGFAFPSTVSGILMAILMSLDIWLVNGFIKNADTQAIFSCAYTISRLFFYGSFAISSAIFPPLVQAIASHDQTKIQDILSKAFLFLEFTIFPVTIGVVLYPDLLIRIFYPGKYLEAVTLLPMLTIARFLVSLLLIVTTWLLAAERPIVCILYSFVGCLFTIIGCGVGLKWGNTFGLTLGYTIGCLLITLLGMIHLTIQVKLPLLWNTHNFLTIIVASGLCGLGSRFLHFPVTGFYTFMLRLTCFFLIVGIYPAMAFIFRVVKPEDTNFIRTLIKR